MPITSIREDRLLKEMGLPRDERNQIEGLSSVARLNGGLELTEEQVSSRAIARLSTNPPNGVGNVQRRTANWLLRAFRTAAKWIGTLHPTTRLGVDVLNHVLFPLMTAALGARFSGNNMSPLPGW